MRDMRWIGIVFIAACGSSMAPPRPASPSNELTPALAPLASWLGDWRQKGATPHTEHWVAAHGAIYGVAFEGAGFEVMIVDDGDGPGKPDGTLRFFAMPGGTRYAEFRQTAVTEGRAELAREGDKFPTTIMYAAAGDAMKARVAGGGRDEAYEFERTNGAPAPELEAADIAFAKATAAQAVDGWVAAFDAGGAMMRRGNRIEGAQAITDAMRETLSKGTLAWAPIASRRSGELGFTVGKATYTGAKPEDGWKSTYVTIWRHQGDGSWKVLFDTGRLVNE